MATEGCKRNRFWHPSPVGTVLVLVYVGSVAKMNQRSPGTSKDIGTGSFKDATASIISEVYIKEEAGSYFKR
jgi:hypothetical protein